MKLCAEIGSNHNGSLERAFSLMEAAKETGCDAVKFQLFRIQDLYSPHVLEREPDLRQRSAREVPLEWLPKLRLKADELGLDLGFSVFGRDEQLYFEAAQHADYLKVSSYQITDPVQVHLAASQPLPLVMSLGMADEEEACCAVDYARPAWHRLTLLHCVSSYPAPAHEANLRSIPWIRETFCKAPVGWSDHTGSAMVLLRAIHHYKIDHLEFHLDLDCMGWEYDGGHCWLPSDIKAVLGQPALSNAFTFHDEGYYSCDGKKTKAPSVSEAAERMWRSDPSDGLRPMLAARKETVTT